METKKPAVIFDFDGTIADSFDYVSDFLIAEARPEDVQKIKKEQLRNLSMLAMARKLGFSNLRLPLLYFRGRHRMKKSIKNLNSYQGIPDLIKQLHKENYKIFILSSNNRRNINAFLRHNNLRGYFTRIYGSVGVFGKAPAIRRLLLAYKISRHRAVYIGDELRDIEAAHYLNMPVIAVSWGFARNQDIHDAKPTYIAEKTSDLIKIIKKI
jgi:phosphoglycolate phosphatase